MNGHILGTMTAAVLLSGCAAAPPAPVETPLRTTMSEILKDPWRYDGMLVRVRGTFDECHMYTCHFCETAQTSSRTEDEDGKCMGVSFWSKTELLEPAGSDEHVQRMRWLADDLAEQNARFTTVTIESRYDATCSGVPEPGSMESGETDRVVCMDRSSQLREARVVQVHIRRHATAGRISLYFNDSLVPADDEEAERLMAAFLGASSAFATWMEAIPIYFYVWKNLPTEWLKNFGIEAADGACICLLEDCGGIQWPVRFGDAAFDVPANPHECWLAERRGGVWKFPLQ